VVAGRAVRLESVAAHLAVVPVANVKRGAQGELWRDARW
jgi:hypothetical protein